MHEYLSWDEKIITDFSDANISSLYNQGYVFTRKGKGVMNKTRSIRIDLSKFELSSENRRILRKTEELALFTEDIPFGRYTWEIGKMAKDFYDTKFGKGTFSANKIKEVLTNQSKTNFDALMIFHNTVTPEGNVTVMTQGEDFPVKMPLRFPNANEDGSDPMGIGYAVCYDVYPILHYSYPFYDLEKSPSSMGMGMMLRAILWSRNAGKKYIYLGSAQRSGDVYKLQFKGLEWFDGESWSEDLERLKNEIK